MGEIATTAFIAIMKSQRFIDRIERLGSDPMADLLTIRSILEHWGQDG